MSIPHNAEEPKITRWFLIAIALIGLIYVCFELTPSSYGVFLNVLQASDSGPVAGVSREIRSDEWSVNTPLLQAAVRNRFQRINETSFYREDLRNFIALPLKDWSLIFKPQLWAFFLAPPAIAFSIYWAYFMCACLAGYYLLFLRLQVPPWLAIAATVIVYFSGFTQFWWTTLGPLLAGLPWILLILFTSMPPWAKVLLSIWAFPTFVFAYVYPVPLITLAWGALILILAFRPDLLRSPGNLAAIAAGSLAVAIVLYFYFGDILSIMLNTVYPGRRIGSPGGTPLLAVLSELFPYLSFRLGDYQNLAGKNICEIGALGSFLPLLTLCLVNFQSLRNHAAVRRTLLILLAGFIAITLWETAPVPAWIGRILLWDRGPSMRWLFTSGLLLTAASLAIWSNRLVVFTPLRIGIFVLLGPVASVVTKFVWLTPAFSQIQHDILLCAIAAGVGLAAWMLPAESLAPLLLLTVAFMNVYAFARFNPLQPAWPIFDPPETDVLLGLREKAAASPGGVLADTQSFGATLNGVGIRSVAHVQLTPNLALFRSYFHAMNPERFNQVFNRYGHIQLAQIPVPDSPQNDVIQVPFEAFAPIRNLRKLVPGPPGVCTQPSGGAVDKVTSEGPVLTIAGWAPWKTESAEQGIRVLTARTLQPGTLTTVKRPDIAEQLQDYGFVRSGFRLQISTADGKPIRPDEVVLLAFGTDRGEIRLSCCGCIK